MALSGRGRLGALVAVWLLPTLILFAITWSVYARYRINVSARLDASARAAIVAELRSIVSTGEGGAWPEAARRTLANRGPVVVGLWHEGRAVARIAARGETTAAALDIIAAQLRQHDGVAALAVDAREAARFKVDIAIGRAPVLGKDSRLAGTWRAVFGLDLLPLLALHPGLEGIGVHIDGEREVVLLADELVRGRLLTAQTPVKQVPELSIGVNIAGIDATLAQVAGLSLDEFNSSQRDYYRLRTDSFVEQPADQRGQAPIALVRGLPPRPELTAASLRSAAIAGGRYLVAHLAANGRYIYEADLTTGKGTDPNVPGPYSIPRHAGTTYFLAELYRHTGEEFLREPVERAFLHLKELIDAGGCRGTTPRGASFACVVDKGQGVANLGSTALTVVALAEYRRATGDPRYDDLARRLAEWILFMQRSDGSFAHLYDIRQARKNEELQLLYFSGEAALAMARMYLVVGDKRYIDAARRALDNLIDWYDFFVGGFIYGQEHWLCISAEAVWPALKDDRYRAFCDGYAGFLRDQQIGPGDFPDQEDLVGGYGVTPFVMPFNTPAGSQSEAMISAYLLGKYHGRPSAAIRGQVLSAMHYVLGQQIRAESSWDVARADAIGAMPANPIDRNVRIDFVQHTCSALIRSVELIETAPR